MGQKSKIDRLPPEVRELVAGLIDSGKTIEEIQGKLWELVGENKINEEELPSRSGIGRFRKRMVILQEKLTRSREVAKVLVRDFGDAEESKTARLNIELMHNIVTDLMLAAAEAEAKAAEEGEEGDPAPIPFEPMDVMLLAKGIDHLAKAKKSDADVLLKAKEEANKKALAAVKKVGKSTGLSSDAIAAIERELKLL